MFPPLGFTLNIGNERYSIKSNQSEVNKDLINAFRAFKLVEIMAHGWSQVMIMT